MSNYKGKLIEDNIEEIKKKNSEGVPLMEIARNLNIKYDTLIRHLKRLNIDYNTNQGRKGIPHHEMRVSAIRYIQSSSIIKAPLLRKKLIEDGIKENKCERCGITEWFGGELPLELHHLDGNHYNNRLENLVILCSNCHAQLHGYNKATIKPKEMVQKPKNTSTHKKREKVEYFCENCGKKLEKKSKTGLCGECVKISQRKVERPSKEELTFLISTMPYVKIAKKFNVSDKTIIKWCKFYGIDYKTIHKNKKQ